MEYIYIFINSISSTDFLAESRSICLILWKSMHLASYLRTMEFVLGNLKVRETHLHASIEQ